MKASTLQWSVEYNPYGVNGEYYHNFGDHSIKYEHHISEGRHYQYHIETTTMSDGEGIEWKVSKLPRHSGNNVNYEPLRRRVTCYKTLEAAKAAIERYETELGETK